MTKTPTANARFGIKRGDVVCYLATVRTPPKTLLKFQTNR